MQKIRDRRFRTLEAAYSGHSPLDHFEADIGTLELPLLKRNVVTLVFLYVLDDYGYVLDADFKVFDDEGFNSAWEINKDQTLEVDFRSSYRASEGCGNPGANVTPERLFPRPRWINEFNETIWALRIFLLLSFLRQRSRAGCLYLSLQNARLQINQSKTRHYRMLQRSLLL